jgi:hypothetical protein
VISLWLYKENNKLRDCKNVFTLHILPRAQQILDFVVLTTLTHPKKILFVELQIGKGEMRNAKDLSAPLSITRSAGMSHTRYHKPNSVVVFLSLWIEAEHMMHNREIYPLGHNAV